MSYDIDSSAVIKDLIEQLKTLDIFSKNDEEGFKKGSAAKYAETFGFDLLSRAIKEKRIRTDQILFLGSFGLISPSVFADEENTGYPLESKVMRHFNEKCTSLIVRSLNEYDEIIGKITDGLSSFSDTSVNCNIYCTPAFQQTFPIHWDDHDVLIWQTQNYIILRNKLDFAAKYF